MLNFSLYNCSKNSSRKKIYIIICINYYYLSFPFFILSTKDWLTLFVFLISILTILCFNYHLSFPFLPSAKDWFNFVYILFIIFFFFSFCFQITLFIDFISNSTNSSRKKRYVQKASIDAMNINTIKLNKIIYSIMIN